MNNTELQEKYTQYLNRCKVLMEHGISYKSQDYFEFIWEMEVLEGAKKDMVVETGVLYGAWPYLLAPSMPKGSRYIGIDPHPYWSIAGIDRLSWVVSELMEAEIIPLIIEEKAEDGIETVKSVLGERTIDILHIDGDHTKEGAMTDWNLFKPLMTPGGFVIFHDMYARSKEAVDVKDVVFDIYWPYRMWTFKNSEALKNSIHQKGVAILQMPDERDEIVQGKENKIKDLDDPLSLINI